MSLSIFMITITVIALIVNNANAFYFSCQNKEKTKGSISMALRDVRNTYPILQRQNAPYKNSLILSSPFVDAFRVFDSIFEDIMDSNRFNIPNNGLSREDTFMMNVDIIENSKQFELIFDLPGVNKEDISITLDADNIMNISAKRTERFEEQVNTETADENGNQDTTANTPDILSSGPAKYHRQERFAGTVSRSFIVPDDVDTENITSIYENGLLSLVLSRKNIQPKEERKRIIPIKTGGKEIN